MGRIGNLQELRLKLNTAFNLETPGKWGVPALTVGKDRPKKRRVHALEAQLLRLV